MKDTHPPRRPRHPGNSVARRNRDLALIHQGRKQLGLDEDTYRAMLLRVTGKSSCSDMLQSERSDVIVELLRLGFVRPTPKFPQRPKRTADVPMLRKIEALLADARRPWSYAHSMAKRMFGAERLEFLRDDELRKVVQALSIDAQRRGKPEQD